MTDTLAPPSTAATPPAGRAGSMPPPWIRVAVRDVLERAPSFRTLGPAQRQALAQAMVKVSTLAAELVAEEGQSAGEIERRDTARPLVPLSRAQSAQPEFGESANRIAGVTKNVLNAVSFPRFVTDLINGVFKAMLDANAQQMNQYVQLLNAVSASAEGFERSQFGLVQVRQWVADHFPESIEYDAPDPEDLPKPGEKIDPDDLEEFNSMPLRLRSGASMPGEAEIRATLGVPPEESIDASNPEKLVPFARRYLARQRQQQLATMVMMGMQRIVIDSGRINASMRFHIDTRSAAAEDKGSEFGVKNRVKAGGSFGVGPWGASAEVENTISYVSTERTQRTEEINTDLELNSSVELNFHTDYLPLNQMAAQAQADRIRNSTLNPAADFPDPSAARNARLQAQQQSEQQRRAGIDKSVAEASKAPPPSPLPAPAAGPAPARTSAPGATPAPVPAPAPPAVSPSPQTSGSSPAGPSPGAQNPNAANAPKPGTSTPSPPAAGSGGVNNAAAPSTAGNASPSAGNSIGAATGGAIGTVVGTAVAGTIGAAAGGLPAGLTGPIGGAIGGAVGTAVGGAVGGAIESGVRDMFSPAH